MRPAQSLPRRGALASAPPVRPETHPKEATTAATVEVALRALLAEVLGLSSKRVAGFTDETLLFGALPELDSLAVANFLNAFEERFAVLIEDQDVEAEDFDSFGRLLAFTKRMALR